MTDNLRQSFLETIENQKSRVFENLKRSELIQESLDNRETITSESGALAYWTYPDSTGRSPEDTFIVKSSGSENKIDWSCEPNRPIEKELFEELFTDALETLSRKSKIYITDKVIGAESKYALPVKTVTDKAVTSLFTDNMFREVPSNIRESVFADEEFLLLALPYDKIQTEKYEGRLRKIKTTKKSHKSGKTSHMVIVLDVDRKIGLVYGSSYCGAVKKLMFTAMNYFLPEQGVLPFHAGANKSKTGKSALFLGLSGTGKTTLSTDENRPLIGDDEHGWSGDGVFNMEGGCYAKLIGFNAEKEPEIAKAAFTKRLPSEHGCIVENAMIYPDGRFDFNDSRLTKNSRVSYPMRFIDNADLDSKAGHPTTIIFLTADASGVLPPVAKLDRAQAMLWFLMGYTSKLAGTEIGIVDPQTAFSRFFGAPFMPRNPADYTDLLGQKMDQHGVEVYLINTGWSGGAFGVGQRMDITVSRNVVSAALNGDLTNVEYEQDKRFHICIPKACPGVDENILNPRNTWSDKNDYDARADKLAGEFAEYFDKVYAGKVGSDIESVCPGR